MWWSWIWAKIKTWILQWKWLYWKCINLRIKDCMLGYTCLKITLPMTHFSQRKMFFKCIFMLSFNIQICYCAKLAFMHEVQNRNDKLQISHSKHFHSSTKWKHKGANTLFDNRYWFNLQNFTFDLSLDSAANHSQILTN